MKKQRLLVAVATLATLFASTIATSACLWYFYQPEEPECLSEK